MLQHPTEQDGMYEMIGCCRKILHPPGGATQRLGLSGGGFPWRVA